MERRERSEATGMRWRISGENLGENREEIKIGVWRGGVGKLG